MRIPLLAVAALSLALGGCTTAESVLGRLGGATVPTDGSYIQQAAAGDLFEMQAAQLALTQAQRPDVRALARELLETHSQATQRLSAAALQAGLSAPAPALTVGQQQMLGQLQQTGPDGFDAAYLRSQLAAHETAIRLHDAYALSGDTEPLRFVASSAAAAVYGHLEEVRRIRRNAGLD